MSLEYLGRRQHQTRWPQAGRWRTGVGRHRGPQGTSPRGASRSR